jgi:hypothetical protein
MSDKNEPVTARELELVSKQIATGFEGVHSRMSRFEEEIRPAVVEQGKKIAVLEYQAQQAKDAADAATDHVQNSKRSTRNAAGGWSAAVAGFLMLLLEIAHRMGWLADSAAAAAAAGK